jgi:hypothetical protein
MPRSILVFLLSAGCAASSVEPSSSEFPEEPSRCDPNGTSHINPGRFDRAIDFAMAVPESSANVFGACSTPVAEGRVLTTHEAVIEWCREQTDEPACRHDCLVRELRRTARQNLSDAATFVEGFPDRLRERPDCASAVHELDSLRACLGDDPAPWPVDDYRAHVVDGEPREVMLAFRPIPGLVARFRGVQEDPGCDAPPVWSGYANYGPEIY